MLELAVVGLPGRQIRRSHWGEISAIELAEHELLALELAQTDLLPHRAGECEVRCFLPHLQSCGLSHPGLHPHVLCRQPCRSGTRGVCRQSAIIVCAGRSGLHGPRHATGRWGSWSRRRRDQRRSRSPAMSRGNSAAGAEAGRPVEAGVARGQPRGVRGRCATKASRPRTGGSAAREASRRAGHRSAAWRWAPWLKPMQGHNSKKAPQGVVLVNRAIVYQNRTFSHSLALHLTASSVRCAPASGSSSGLAFGFRGKTMARMPKRGQNPPDMWT
jgi:hypothetical protein